MKLFLYPVAGAVLSWFLAYPCADAQRVWRGTVADVQNAHVPFVGVAALSLPDSAVLSSGLSDESGRFALRVPAGARLLRLSSAGYATLYVSPDTLRAEGQTFVMLPDATLLGEAGVTAARPVSRIVGDALVTNVENTLLATAGTADDVLGRIPGIVRKQDGLEVVGKGSPVIYINGRRMRDPSELERLASADIRSVEVIRNPGARYDASVAAVVRIRTVRRSGDGFGADVAATYGQGDYAEGKTRIDLNYRHRSLDVFGSFGYRHDNYYWDSRMEQEVYVDRVWRQSTQQHFMNHMRRADGTFGLNYDFGERHSAGLRYTLERTAGDRGEGWFDGDVSLDGQPYDRLENTLAFTERHRPTHKLNAYYTGRIGRGELSVDADWYADGSTKHQTAFEDSREQDDRVVRSSNPCRNRLVASKAAYVLPLGGGRLTAGGQYTRTDRHDDYLVPVADYGLVSSRSGIEEWQAAAFAEYARALGRWQLTAGVRYEHVSFDYAEQGVRRPDQCRTYDNLFPSLSAATAFGPVQFMTSYVAKTSRPTYSQLSNNMVYANRFLMQSGNPMLRPSVCHDVTLTAVWKWLQAVADFKHERDCVIQWGSSLPDNPSATKIYPVNKDVPSLTVVLTARPRVGLWQPMWNVAVIRNWLRLDVAGGRRAFDNPMAVATWNNAFDLPRGFTANADFTWQSSGDYQNISLTGRANCYLSLSLRKSFLHDALSLTAGVNDVFRSMGRTGAKVHMYQATLLQAGGGDTRRFALTVRYRLNPARSKYKGAGAAADELRRL